MFKAGSCSLWLGLLPFPLREGVGGLVCGGYLCLNTLAWNNEIGLQNLFGSILLVSRTEVMINRDSWGG